MHYLRYERRVGTLRLQNHQSPLVFSSSPSGHLRHHHVGVFVSPEVGIVHHGVGIEYANYAYAVEVQPLAYHLRAYQYVGLAACEVADDAFVSVASAGSVEIHACYTGLGEQFQYVVFNLLRAVALCLQVGAAARRALCGHLVSAAAVVAGQRVGTPVER